jgi:hypothetical protein
VAVLVRLLLPARAVHLTVVQDQGDDAVGSDQAYRLGRLMHGGSAGGVGKASFADHPAQAGPRGGQVLLEFGDAAA